MSGHTPGPWMVSATRYGTIYVEATAVIEKHLVQEVCSVGPTETGREQQVANARLIAAAPDLLDALSSIVDWIDEGGNGAVYTIERCARAAIKKATEA